MASMFVFKVNNLDIVLIKYGWAIQMRKLENVITRIVPQLFAYQNIMVIVYISKETTY